MFTGKVMVSMKESIAKGRNFYQWWQTQTSVAKLDQTRAQLEYEELENNLPQDLNRIKGTQFVVTDRKGWPPDRKKFVIHSNLQDAAKYGSEMLKYGNYLIKTWQRFQHTYPHQLLSRKFEIRAKHARYRK